MSTRALSSATFQRRTATPRLVPLMGALALAFGSLSAAAADFSVTGPDTTAKTLGSGSGQNGNVSAAGALAVSGGTVAVTITGNNATLNNLGSITQTGTGRVIRDNTGVTGLVVNNGSATNSTALMQAADADVIQMAKTPASVTLNNWGQMISLNASAGGSQAVDFSGIASGANVINNYATGVMKAYEADAVRPGVNGVVYNAGKIISITTTGSSSDGIDFQNNTGGQVTNAATGLVEGGRHGITGGALDATVTFNANITNLAGGIIQGDNGSGINLDGFNNKQLVTVINGGLIVGNGVTGDGDGVDVDGLVNITNTGTIRSRNAVSALADGPAFSEGITVGGGSIVNAGLIEGLVAPGNTNAYGRGITLTGNDITTGPLAGTRDGIYGNATVVNQAGGVIRGQNDSAIVATGNASGYTVSITNQAGGTVQGGSATAAAIVTGVDNDSVVNGGLVDGRSSGKAIDLGAGNNTFAIVGGQASVLGDISGGVGGTNAMTLDPGAGNGFGYAGAISNFATVDVLSGTVTLSGASTYGGVTTVANGATLVLDGTGRLASASALALNGGRLSLADAVGNVGQTFATLALGGHSYIDLNGSTLTFLGLGSIAAGSVLTVDGTWAGLGLRFLGDLGSNADFEALLANTTIDGSHVTMSFDGAYTHVTAAVPEPSTVALMLAGLVLLGAAAKRRKQG